MVRRTAAEAVKKAKPQWRSPEKRGQTAGVGDSKTGRLLVAEIREMLGYGVFTPSEIRKANEYLFESVTVARVVTPDGAEAEALLAFNLARLRTLYSKLWDLSIARLPQEAWLSYAPPPRAPLAEEPPAPRPLPPSGPARPDASRRESP